LIWLRKSSSHKTDFLKLRLKAIFEAEFVIFFFFSGTITIFNTSEMDCERNTKWYLLFVFRSLICFSYRALYLNESIEKVRIFKIRVKNEVRCRGINLGLVIWNVLSSFYIASNTNCWWIFWYFLFSSHQLAFIQCI